MLQRLRKLVTSTADSDQEGEIWLQRMTRKGGWERMHEQFVQDEFLDRPTSDDDFRVTTLPGRYRAIQRINGRHNEVLWEYETDDAEEYYKQQRRKARQRERLSEMTLEELTLEKLEVGLGTGGNELTELEYSEIKERFEQLGGYDAYLSNEE